MTTATPNKPLRYSRWLPGEFASIGRPVPVVTYRGVDIGIVRRGFCQVDIAGTYWGGFVNLDEAKSFVDKVKIHDN